MKKFLILFEKMILDEQKVDRKYSFGQRHSDMALYLLLQKYENHSYLNTLINSNLCNYDFSKTFRQQEVVDGESDTYIIWHLLQCSKVFWNAYKIYQLGMTYEEYEFSDYYLNLGED